MRRQPKLEVAPLYRRVVASLIDVLVGILALVAMVGAGIGVFSVARKRRINFRLFRGLAAGSVNIRDYLQSRPVQFALRAVAFAGSILTKQRRSPGSRILGLRRVDARTGAEVSRRQEMIRAGTRQAWRMLCQRLIPTPKPRQASEQEKLKSDMQAAQRRYADDQDALQREVMRVYRENKVAPTRVSFLPVLARLLAIAVIDLPAFWSPLKQSLLDHLAGTVVALDRPSRRSR
jgi:hypothetical protein